MPPTPGVLLQLVEQNDEKHEDGHRRLRQDWRELERRVVTLESAQHAASLHFAKLDNTRVDVTALQFGTKTVIGIVAICLGLAAGQWAVVVSVSSLTSKVDAMQRRQELQQYEIQGLKEEIMKQRNPK